MEVESFISVNALTALFTLINTILTFCILKKFLFKPVKKMIDDRQKEIDGIYQDAAEKKAEAEKLCDDYSQKLRCAKEESAAMLRDASKTAQTRSEQIVREAKQEASAIREKANADAALARKKALNDAKDEISAIALDLAEKVVEKELKPQDQESLIADFIDRMEDPL